MQPLEQPDPNLERANRLYWESGKSVNQIADELDLSKGMLYEMIHPLRAGLPCPRCSAEMEYSNRTARERALLTCRSCKLESHEAEVRAAPAGPAPAPEPAPTRRPTPPLGPARPRRDPRVIGAGLLLIATGIWLFRDMRKR